MPDDLFDGALPHPEPSGDEAEARGALPHPEPIRRGGRGRRSSERLGPLRRVSRARTARAPSCSSRRAEASRDPAIGHRWGSSCPGSPASAARAAEFGAPLGGFRAISGEQCGGFVDAASCRRTDRYDPGRIRW